MSIKRVRFDGRLLMLGCGSVGRCTLPLILRHVDMPASEITVMDFEDVRRHDRGAASGRRRLQTGAPDAGQLSAVLGELVGAWRHHRRPVVERRDARNAAWCGEHDVRFVNTSLEEWDPYGDIANKSPYDRSLYSRQMRVRKLKSRAELARERESDRDPRSRRQSRPGQPLHEAGAARDCGHDDEGGCRRRPG